jgi:Zn-dependent protease
VCSSDLALTVSVVAATCLAQPLTAQTIYLATFWIIPVLIAITFHEAAHGFVAHLLGDDTAWRLGRVSFNPLKHVDPVGTILLPGILLLLRSPFLFGYAKPVPVNFRALRSARCDMMLAAPLDLSASRYVYGCRARAGLALPASAPKGR